MFTKEYEYVIIETTSVTVFLYVYLLDFSEQADSLVCLNEKVSFQERTEETKADEVGRLALSSVN